MTEANRFGTFSGEPEAVWLNLPRGGRKMELSAEITFTEAKSGRVWRAPKGVVIDGASIPRALWTLVGSPYTGDYRRASILHDKACEDFPTDGPDRKAADIMFQLACRAGGCSREQAVLLYLGVRIGSSWAQSLVAVEENAVRIEPSAEDLAVQTAFREMALEVRAQQGAEFVEADPEQDVDAVRAVVACHGLGA